MMLDELKMLGSYKKWCNSPLHCLTLSTVSLIRQHLCDVPDIALPTTEDLSQLTAALVAKSMDHVPRSCHLYILATGLGGRVSTIKRPDLVLSNTRDAYGSTWADKEDTHTSPWRIRHGHNQLHEDMYYLLREDHVKHC
jgi:hypothetical protein